MIPGPIRLDRIRPDTDYNKQYCNSSEVCSCNSIESSVTLVDATARCLDRIRSDTDYKQLILLSPASRWQPAVASNKLDSM